MSNRTSPNFTQRPKPKDHSPAHFSSWQTVRLLRRCWPKRIRNTFPLAAMILVLTFSSARVSGQNPLRSAEPNQTQQANSHGNLVDQIVAHPEERFRNNGLNAGNGQMESGQTGFVQQGRSNGDSSRQFNGEPFQASHATQPNPGTVAPQLHTAEEIRQVGFSPIPGNDSQDANSALIPKDESQQNFVEREQESFIEREQAEKKPKSENLGQMISKVGMNLAFVLAVAVGFILIAKNWIRPRLSSSKGGGEMASLQVKEVLSLDSKSTLRLVHWQNSRILVATDAQGIKSVNVLNPTFDQTMDELPPEPAPEQMKKVEVGNRTQPETGAQVQKGNGIDERLLRLLLENANGQKR